jgi:hypothetical protein
MQSLGGWRCSGGPFIERTLLDEWGARMLEGASRGGAGFCGSPLIAVKRAMNGPPGGSGWDERGRSLGGVERGLWGGVGEPRNLTHAEMRRRHGWRAGVSRRGVYTVGSDVLLPLKITF